MPHGQRLLEKIEVWLHTIVEPHTKIDDIEKTYGWDSPDNIVCTVIIVATQVIYQKRLLGNPYHSLDVKHLLANQMMLE